MPNRLITDLWEVRSCFQRHFARPPLFIVQEDQKGIGGLLPLSWIEENQCYGYFPGETWQRKTWIEQNRIVCCKKQGLESLLSCCPENYYLRYLLPAQEISEREQNIDEVGYIFDPSQYDYNFDNYLKTFNHKSLKNILKEISCLEKKGVSFRFNDLSDLDLMIRMNLDRFGEESYFFDSRFQKSFVDLALFLKQKNWLKLTTVLIENKPAAIDLGAIYNGVYSVIAGGVNPVFIGVAKLINFHHIRFACRQKLSKVDFLCGDFNWKKRFHLMQRPLFVLDGNLNRKTEQLPYRAVG